MELLTKVLVLFSTFSPTQARCENGGGIYKLSMYLCNINTQISQSGPKSLTQDIEGLSNNHFRS